MGGTHGCWGCCLVSLWSDSLLSLKGHGDQEMFLSTGRKRMSLPPSRRARRRICETRGLSASPQSVGRWWSNFPWKPFLNIKAGDLTWISPKHEKNFLLWGWLNTWNRMPREAMESSSLEMLKTQLAMALSNSEQRGWSRYLQPAWFLPTSAALWWLLQKELQTTYACTKPPCVNLWVFCAKTRVPPHKCCFHYTRAGVTHLHGLMRCLLLWLYTCIPVCWRWAGRQAKGVSLLFLISLNLVYQGKLHILHFFF